MFISKTSVFFKTFEAFLWVYQATIDSFFPHDYGNSDY